MTELDLTIPLNISNILDISMQLQTIEDRIQAFLEKKFRYSKSFATKKSYTTALNRFKEFLRARYNLDINQAIRLSETEKLDPIDVLDDFFTYLANYRRDAKTGFSNRTMRFYIVVSKEFLNSQGLHIYNEDIKQKFRLPKKDHVYEKGLTKEILSRILHNSSPKLQTVILMCASSGMRIAELVQLKLSDIDFDTNPTTLQIRKETAKTRETRFTCLTSEATKSLKDYLSRTFGWTEDYSKDRYIFLQLYEERIKKLRNTLENVTQDEKKIIQNKIKELEKIYSGLSQEEKYDKAISSAKNTFEEMLAKVTDSIPDLSMKNENGRKSIHFHAFRSWFKTQVTDAHQSDFAEALMGHKSVKLTYYRQNDKARSKTYLSVEHAITIADTEKIDKNFTEIQEKNQDMQKQIDDLRSLLNNILKSQADKET